VHCRRSGLYHQISWAVHHELELEATRRIELE